MDKQTLNSIIREAREEYGFDGNYLTIHVTTESRPIIEGIKLNLENKNYQFLEEKDLLVIKGDK